MSRVRETATQPRGASFASGLVSSRLDPTKGAEFARLTHAGQLVYAGLRSDGYDHETAFRDARYTHGTRRS